VGHPALVAGIDLIEAAGFEAFITNDKRMEKEQALHRRPFATLMSNFSSGSKRVRK
jgi:hypothetical protein